MQHRRTKIIALSGVAAAVMFGLRALRAARARHRRLDGWIVAITGASRGLGLAMAREFGARGASIAICGRDPDVLERAVDDLSARNIDVFALDCDVRDRADIERFVQSVLDRFGRFDILVNNAGTIAVGPASVMNDGDYRDAMETHFWGARGATEAVLASMRGVRDGRIVNIASIGGLVSVPHLLPYSASKFALVGYSLGLQEELALEGISVTTVCPGLMRTGSPRNATFKGDHRAEYAWFDFMASSPLTSISAASAARAIADAAVARRRLVVLSWQAQLLYVTARLAPNAVSMLNTLVAAALPKSAGQRATARGSESESAATRSALTTLGREAERDLNQLPAR
jgi:NAD(P)-dependent dehydrogenase (short-subunit alcohol dehydrogenase family)